MSKPDNHHKYLGILAIILLILVFAEITVIFSQERWLNKPVQQLENVER